MPTFRYPLSDLRIRYHFMNENGQAMPLTYRLYDHRLLSRWWGLMHALSPSSYIHENGFFFGQLLDDQDFLIPALNECIDKVNGFVMANNLPQLKIPIVIKKPCPQSVLSELHCYFERYMEDPFLQGPLREPLLLMNIYIHRLESFADGARSESAHIEVLPIKTAYLPFENADYKLFTADWRWGELYLTYGITGVPTLNGFWNNSAIRPQHCMSQGMLLGFFGDQKFDNYEALHAWMRERGMDPADLRWALGYLPLGILEDPAVSTDQSERVDFLLKLGKHRKVERFELLGPAPAVPCNPLWSPPPDVMKVGAENKIIPDKPVPSLTPATWPYDQEIFYHLDLVPYIDLGVKFDPRKMLEEARKASAYFVTHRDYDQDGGGSHGKWKALGLRSLHGDWEKTQYHTSYEFEGKAVYQQTPFAQLCPETMRFLESITDLEQCERVRFMLLEPGASIKTHRDSKTNDVSLAVNISLNMPDECLFWCDANSDGSANAYTRQVPFSNDGSVILFNNAKYHRVENRSSVPRIHIIFHGPIRFTDDYILQRARRQNVMPSRKELLKRLVRKKCAQGESFDKTPLLLKDWIGSGLDANMLGKGTRLVVWEHEGSESDPKKYKSLEQVTIASAFPLGHDVVKEAALDDHLALLSGLGEQTAVIVAAGTLLSDLNPFIVTTMRLISRMREENAILAGHLMDFPGAGKIPYLHEQFLILNLEAWKKLGSPRLGPLFSPEMLEFPQHDRGPDLHDDYTPTRLIPGKGVAARSGHANWGSRLMARALTEGMTVLNLPQELRFTKHYSYPRDNNPEATEQVEDIIRKKLDMAKEEVFFFNNEDLKVAHLPNFQPNKVISVSAGFKALKIMDQYDLPDNGEVHYVDFSANALAYIQGLVKQKNLSDLESHIDQTMRGDKMGKWAEGAAKHSLASTVRDHFNGEGKALERRLLQASKAKFHQVNLVMEPESLARLVNPQDRFIAWVSNAFYNNHLYYLIGREEAERRYVRLALSIAEKIGQKAFLLAGTRTVVFGSSWKEPHGMLTDGAAQFLSDVATDWRELSHVPSA